MWGYLFTAFRGALRWGWSNDACSPMRVPGPGRGSAEEDGESGIGAASAGGEVVDGVEAVLGGCSDDAGEHALGGRPGPGPVAAPGFAVDDTGPHGLLAPEVGGVDPLDGEEGEHGVGLVGEVLEQAPVGVAAGWPGAQLIEACPALRRGGGPLGGGGKLPGRQGVFDDRLGRRGDFSVGGGKLDFLTYAATPSQARRTMEISCEVSGAGSTRRNCAVMIT